MDFLDCIIASKSFLALSGIYLFSVTTVAPDEFHSIWWDEIEVNISCPYEHHSLGMRSLSWRFYWVSWMEAWLHWDTTCQLYLGLLNVIQQIAGIDNHLKIMRGMTGFRILIHLVMRNSTLSISFIGDKLYKSMEETNFIARRSLWTTSTSSSRVG